MSNFCCTYIENVVVAKEYKGCDGQCVGLVPATTKLMPYKYLDNIAYQFSSWLNSSGYSGRDYSDHSRQYPSSHHSRGYCIIA